MFDVTEKSISQLRTALQSGQTTPSELLASYLARISAYDVAGPALNALVEYNPAAATEAAAADARWAAGKPLGPLDGIPYTAKDSYMVKGLTVAAGSPAFADFVATYDAFTISRLRAAGAILIGLTNMPPMADGGMQRGIYGRAESPYNAAYLTSAYASGSSNGSGTATAASFAAFGLGEETWSSGRAPASHNALCAYTPSRGLISMRGNWPLIPTMDVVVPHTRCMADMLEVLDVLVVEDEQTDGDLWRSQPWIPLPQPSQIRPARYTCLAPANQEKARAFLGKLRIGVPEMYVNKDPLCGTGSKPGIGGLMGRRIETRASIVDLWQQLERTLRRCSAQVIDTDFPVISHYEGDRPGAPNITNRGLVPAEFLRTEALGLSALAWHAFIQANNDPVLKSLAQVDGRRIFPEEPGILPERGDDYNGYFAVDLARYPDYVKQHPMQHMLDVPLLQAGLEGLETTRQLDLEQWMDQHQLDVVAFPTMADVAYADMDRNPATAAAGWRNGVWVANGNLAIRHLGIPSVTVPLGVMADTNMPVGVTLIGRSYDDNQLLQIAACIEYVHGGRKGAPPRTPSLQK